MRAPPLAHDLPARQRLLGEELIGGHRLAQQEDNRRDEHSDHQVKPADGRQSRPSEQVKTVLPCVGDGPDQHEGHQRAHGCQQQRGRHQPGFSACACRVTPYAITGARPAQSIQRQQDTAQHVERIAQGYQRDPEDRGLHQLAQRPHPRRQQTQNRDVWYTQQRQAAEADQQDERHQRNPGTVAPAQVARALNPVATVTQEHHVPDIGEQRDGRHGDRQPKGVATCQLPGVAQQQRRMGDEERAAQQETEGNHRNAQIAPVRVQPEGDAQPEEQDGVEERDCDQRPGDQRGEYHVRWSTLSTHPAHPTQTRCPPHPSGSAGRWPRRWTPVCARSSRPSRSRSAPTRRRSAR